MPDPEASRRRWFAGIGPVISLGLPVVHLVWIKPCGELVTRLPGWIGGNLGRLVQDDGEFCVGRETNVVENWSLAVRLTVAERHTDRLIIDANERTIQR